MGPSEREALFRAVLSLQSLEECERFFADLMTPAEVKVLACRWTVAQLLAAGLTYEEIAETTGASSATISRVKKALDSGAAGYRLALGRLGLG